jgi:sulfatase modifying factor 1
VPSEQPPPQPKQEEPKTNMLIDGTQAGDRHVITFNKIEIPFRWCPPGKFKMGSPKSEKDRYDNEDQVDVTLTKGFWMMETEVTQAMWQAVMGEKLEWDEKYGLGPNYPAYFVDWAMANDFAAKLTEKLVESGQLPKGMKLALPTEAQWEYACRAGTTTATPFGDSLSSEQANFDGNYPYGDAKKGPYLEKTSEVGNYPPNRWGIYDMLGNVWEWCADSYAEKLPGGIDPLVSAEAGSRVARGGSWYECARGCRPAYRLWGDPVDRYDVLGFRLAAVRP